MSSLHDEYSVEEFFNETTGDYDPQLLVVRCDHCDRANHPLPGASVVWSGWRWMGISHQEPCTDYAAKCSVCEQEFRFTVRSPQ